MTRTQEQWESLTAFPNMKRKLKILVCPANEGGCAYYRAWSPFKTLEKMFPNVLEFRYNKNPLGMEEDKKEWKKDWEFEDMHWADIVFTQNLSNYGGPYTARIVGKAKEFGKVVWYDTDDLLTKLYKGHRLHEVYDKGGLSDITRFLYSHADIVTVTQRKFAERIVDLCGGALCIIKNSIDYSLECWNLPRLPAPRKNLIRVGWAGGIHHEEDVKEFSGVPQFVNQRVGREHVHWGFYGKPPIDPKTGKDDWQQKVWENYKRILLRGFKGAQNWAIFAALPTHLYGQFFTQMDIAIAPLQMNEFNDSKSEIKVAECGRYKVPLIASNVGCYDETIKNGVTGYLVPANATKSDWVRVLTKVIKDPKHVKEMGENLHQITEKYFDLNKVVFERLNVLEEIITRKKITFAE